MLRQSVHEVNMATAISAERGGERNLLAFLFYILQISHNKVSDGICEIIQSLPES